ncbi:MAG TPA: hypothetical protein VFE47_03285 [Tepidisphaeraceae bacterium]|nr:hypothetical protein [Tepidisphaeraceae bacterium]
MPHTVSDSSYRELRVAQIAVRFLRVTATAISTLFVIATLFLWIRSQRTQDRVNFISESGTYFGLATTRFGVGLIRVTHFREQWAMPHNQRIPKRGWSVRRYPVEPVNTSTQKATKWKVIEVDDPESYQLPMEPNPAWSRPDVKGSDFTIKVVDIEIEILLEGDGTTAPTGHSWHGFTWQLSESRGVGDGIHNAAPLGISFLSVPWWFLILPGCLLPSIHLRSFLRTRKRLRENRCLACGYDLTANVSGRCPECGLAAASGKQRASASTS